MLIRYPSSVTCAITIKVDASITEVFEFIWDALRVRDGFEVRSWAIRAEEVTKSAREAKRLGLPPRDAVRVLGEPLFEEGFSISGNGLEIVVNSTILPEGPAWYLSEMIYVFSSVDDLIAKIDGQMAMIRALTSALPVRNAYLRRFSDSSFGLVPPHADPTTIMALVSMKEIAADYDDVDAYWAAWDEVEFAGDRAWVSRAIHILDETDFKKAVVESSITLCRAARAGETEYQFPEPSDEETAMMAKMPRYLEPFTYDRTSNTAEFLAVLPKNARLSAADILAILTLQTWGTAAGDIMDDIFVTFADQQTAESESKILLDMGGVCVQYFSSDGVRARLS